jgi:hypothetical protein
LCDWPLVPGQILRVHTSGVISHAAGSRCGKRLGKSGRQLRGEIAVISPEKCGIDDFHTFTRNRLLRGEMRIMAARLGGEARICLDH